LYTAARMRYRIPAGALADSTEWLSHPAKWDSNRGNPAFSDKKLARIQFAAALADGLAAGLITDRRALVEAADSLLPYQEADGSWQVDVGTLLGSPVTYGATLATVMVRRTLLEAQESRFAVAMAQADRWLAARRPDSVMDAAVLLMAEPKRADCMQMILAAENGDGGWGPQPHAPSEVFDTALVVIAYPQAKRGRDYLIRAQLEAGGWPETTRPSGAQSYAQHISTSAWATLALLASNTKR
jgi:hypothetical protein